jgi:hypothetical protein
MSTVHRGKMLNKEVNLRSFSDPLGAPEECVGYRVCDPLGQKIGTVEKIFVNGDGEPEYVRVKMGLFGMRSVLILVVSVSVDQDHKAVTLE